VLLAIYFWQSGTATPEQHTVSEQHTVPERHTVSEQQKQEVSHSQDSQASLKNTIHFSITKDAKMLLLSGTFTDRKQSKLFAKNLRPTYSTTRIKTDASLIDRGGLALAAKILPVFKRDYLQGKIQYNKGALVIEGIVRKQKTLDQINTLLKGASVSLKNLTTVNTKTVPSTPPVKRVAKKKMKKQYAQKSKTPQQKKYPKETKKPVSSPKKTAIVKKREAPKKISTAQTKKKVLRPEKTAAVSLKKDLVKKKPTVLKQRILSKATVKTASPKTKPQSSAIARSRIHALLRSHKIEFLPAKGALTPKGEATVDALSKILSRYGSIHIEIAGHTDSDGSESFNQKLSQLRVDTVKKRLVSKGIKGYRLRAKGYGESRPLVPNTSDENKQKNRRVEIHLLKVIK